MYLEVHEKLEMNSVSVTLAYIIAIIIHTAPRGVPRVSKPQPQNAAAQVRALPNLQACLRFRADQKLLPVPARTRSCLQRSRHRVVDVCAEALCFYPNPNPSDCPVHPALRPRPPMNAPPAGGR